jgi:hypothetical protein
MPAIKFRSVVLPEPLGPMTATFEPLVIENYFLAADTRRPKQTISGRHGRILFVMPFGQIESHLFYLFLMLDHFAKRLHLLFGQLVP